MNPAAIGTSCPRSNVIVACGEGSSPVRAVFQKSPLGARVPSVRRSGCSAPPAAVPVRPARRLAWSGLLVAVVPQLLAANAAQSSSVAPNPVPVFECILECIVDVILERILALIL